MPIADSSYGWVYAGEDPSEEFERREGVEVEVLLDFRKVDYLVDVIGVAETTDFNEVEIDIQFDQLVQSLRLVNVGAEPVVGREVLDILTRGA